MKHAVWLVALLAACGDSTGVDPFPAALVGTWSANAQCVPHCGLTYYDVDAPADTINLMSRGLTTGVSLSLGANGSVRLQVFGTQATDFTGTASVRNGALHVEDSAGDVEVIDYTVRGDTLALSWRDGVQSDLDFDGRVEHWKLRGQLIR